MIYQHRIVIARSGKLEHRHKAFQEVTLDALNAAGSVLIGAWEVYLGQESHSAVWQLRQFESLAAWEVHQDKIRADSALNKSRQSQLYPLLDEINTSIIRLSCASPVQLPSQWPQPSEVRGTERGYIEQRVLRFKPGAMNAHHDFYKAELAPALEADGVKLIGLFDTVIGDGTTNGRSMRSIELRHFRDLASWQLWREAQDTDPVLRSLVKEHWLTHVAELHSDLLRPLDYSLIR